MISNSRWLSKTYHPISETFPKWTLDKVQEHYQRQAHQATLLVESLWRIESSITKEEHQFKITWIFKIQMFINCTIWFNRSSKANLLILNKCRNSLKMVWLLVVKIWCSKQPRSKIMSSLLTIYIHPLKTLPN